MSGDIKVILSDKEMRLRLLEYVACVAGIFVFTRRLRKLGHDKKNVYAFSVMFTQILWTRVQVDRLRRQLQQRETGSLEEALEYLGFGASQHRDAPSRRVS